MKPLVFALSGAALVLALAIGPETAWAHQRPGGGGAPRGGSGSAAPRASAPSGGSSAPRSSSGGSSGSARVHGGGYMGTARDNSGRAVTGGYAVPRSGAPYGGSWRDGRRYPRYNSYLLYGYGGFGLGYLYYDPFWWGYGGYPYGYYGYPYGYGYGYGYDYDRGYTDYTDSGNEQPVEENAEPAQSAHGGLKLKVTPANAEVYIDGYFKGIVSDFSGMFERIELPVGPHRVEIRARGYQTITFEIRIEPHETITYRGEMDPANRK